ERPAKDVKRPLENIRRSAGRMRAMIEQLLEQATIQAGALELTRKEENLRELCVELLKMMEPMAREKSLRLDSIVPDDVVLSCDRPRLLRVLTNLIGNAIKFTPE